MKSVSHCFVLVCFLIAVFVPATVLASVQAGWQQAGWLHDFDVAVKKARSSGRPVLVYFDAVWCSWCQQYKREVLDRSAVKSFLQQHYIPVVIDYDARPDLFHRFGGVGLPFTVVLASEGQMVSRFTGILDQQNFLAMLQENKKRSRPLSEYSSTDGDVVTVKQLHDESYQQFRQAFMQHIELLYSAELGILSGQYITGASLKRVSPQTWMYLMQHKLWPERVKKAISVEQKRLLDRHDGGFFNFLDSTRGVEDYLESSKLLETNAWLTAWFAAASPESKSAALAADSGWRYLRNVLWDKKHAGFWQAQIADNHYYALVPAEKSKRRQPVVDKIKRADTNAQAALALYRTGSDRNNAEMKRYANQTLDFILHRLMKDEQLFHVRDHAETSVLAFPQDWFWVLLAGQEIKGGNQERERKMKIITKQASVWLQQQMNKKPQVTLPVELVSVIARSSCSQKIRFQLPQSACAWALTQLRIEPETPPDAVVPGLLAWEAYLTRED